MKRTFAVVLATGILAATGVAALANDGHGNTSTPTLDVPNDGDIAGGPLHRNDPRVREAQEVGRDGKPAHFVNDGHAHGHSLNKKQ